ncbi:hypothetical protein FAES_5121 [Fibrella aestuarina BUZ 2]|uniref:ZU5 domain-containing protein n=1 Tax=Fibrella aestuarina BUZ 2 TaxID=1166018 RepID=I0KG67_9BACT|nr:hypothetical protein [Fibrella aestuarina]CCH03120.1 hypothetical protein FAES_5121 [Fibrella aestuarina BUZ 2]
MKRIYQAGSILTTLLLAGLLACQPHDKGIVPNPENPATGTPTPVGKPIGTAFTVTISPAGGVVASPDGKLSLTVPAGAVSKATQLTIQPVENTAPNGVGLGYHISPDTLSFAQPLTVDYRYQDNELTGHSAEAIGLAFQNKDNGWQLAQPAIVDKTQRRIRTRLKKARWWSLVTQYQLTPDIDTAMVNEVRNLQLMRAINGEWPTYSTTSSKDDLLTPLVRSAVANQDVRGAYLNGQDWGHGEPADQSWGSLTIDYHDAKILYLAPGKKPKTNNPVKIGIAVSTGGANGLLVLFSDMYVKGDISLTLDGRDFGTNILAQGALANNILSLAIHGVDSTGKNGTMVVFVNDPRVGSFKCDLDKTSVSTTNEAAKKLEETGESVYSACSKDKAAECSVFLTKLGPSATTGYLRVEGRVAGTLVTRHEEDNTCGVIKHITTQVHADFSLLVKR